ncbi:MAG: lipopolysaccharide heptosyltransferase II [Planctomycetes bacterium]|nr:lipopolysaccharide heptosyltransferase II [Planctomycetota bacterium]
MTSDTPRGLHGVRRLLVRMPNWVGDVVMATPTLRALRTALPDAEIVLACKRYVAPLIGGHPDADRLLVLEEHEERGLRGWWRVARRVRAQTFDAVLLLTNSLSSVIPVFLARVPRRIGYTGDGRGPLLTDRLGPELSKGKRVPTPMPVYYQRLLDLVGVASVGVEYVLPSRDGAREGVRALFGRLGRDPGRPLVGLNPGARFGSSKLWPPARFGELARELIARGLQPVLLCGPGETEIAAEIRAEAGDDLLDTSATPIGLDVLPAAMRELDLLVSTDSGPRHVAVAGGCPVVVVMGSTWPEWTAWNLERTRVVRHAVDCGPCHLKTCPTDHRCMNLVTVSEVMAAVAALLPGTEAPSEG